MISEFSYAGSAARIVFGEGKSNSVAEWVEKSGRQRALVLSTPHQRADAEALAKSLGQLSAGVFAGAVMHTPIDVTERAMEAVAEAKADCVVSLGGG